MDWVSWKAAGAAGLAALVALIVVVLVSGGDGPSDSQGEATRASTAKVERGDLAAMVSLNGTLAFRARPDGSPYSAVNQASGIYTELPAVGQKVDCGDVFYRVDDAPVLLLCGPTPAYRSLSEGDAGDDVRQLNQNLRKLGYDSAAGVRIGRDSDVFGSETAAALGKLQAARGLERTGALALDEAVFQPESVRISKVIGIPGGSARAGSDVALTTSNTPVVHVDLDASQAGTIREGDKAKVTLPDGAPSAGRVISIGNVAETGGKGPDAGYATIPVQVELGDPSRARGLEGAPVQVEVSTKGVKNALNVPAAALVGKDGGGFAVELVEGNGETALVPVRLGLFDSAGGRVQVEGDLSEGDEVVVPAL
ncbi:MAG: peptidoglycan-binding protein [Solirubrobacterales bacterium]|nr:peptidoglycan-binding protein [Solirubrobacterales bacterium]